MTNNSTKSRSKYAKKFHSLGISVSEVCSTYHWLSRTRVYLLLTPFCLQDEIFSSSFAAAMYLKVNNFPKEKKVCLRATSCYFRNAILGCKFFMQQININKFHGLTMFGLY